MTADPVLRAINTTVEAIRARSNAHWIIAFSGGKDSSAALRIFMAAFKRANTTLSKVTILYCDTGVENPILDSYAKNFLRILEDELCQTQLPFRTKLLKAPISDRFFVRIIGRGYPPPTNSFRWCTTGLRIRPVSRYIEQQDPDNTVVILGLRKAESRQRDRSLSLSKDLYWQKQREGKGEYDLFLPIVEMGLAEVWDAIFGLSSPRALDNIELESLYRGASGECPVIKSPTAPPCASGRFGCWTCTVVRRDKSAAELIRAGHTQLQPYLAFRDWLAAFRSDPSNRWNRRRSGADGLGPLTIGARKQILKKVDELEDLTRSVIISPEERGIIAALWTMEQFPRLNFKEANHRTDSRCGDSYNT